MCREETIADIIQHQSNITFIHAADCSADYNGTGRFLYVTVAMT